MSSGSGPLPVVVLPAALSSSDPPSTNPPDSDPSRNVSSPGNTNAENRMVFEKSKIFLPVRFLDCVCVS